MIIGSKNQEQSMQNADSIKKEIDHKKSWNRVMNHLKSLKVDKQ